MHKLGKLNSSIDVIPLQGSSSDGRLKPTDRHKPQDCPNRGFYDPQIISRVQAYMYENVDKTYIDINEMANYLQKKHRDYRGRKRSPFRAMVRRAYDEINESFGKKPQSPHWQDNEEDDDEVDLESDSQSDVMGNTVIEMYKRNTAKRNGNSSDKELINISSDEEQSKVEEIPPKKTKQSKNTEEGEQKNLQPALTTSISKISATVKPEHEVVEALPGKEELKVSTLEKLPKKRQREKEVNNRQNTNLFAKKKKDIPVVETRVKFADIGGSTKVLETVCKLLVHIKHPEVFKQLGISPPRGFLLHGPPGCGKTLLAHAIAGELDIPLLKVAAPELIAGVSGESEARVRELFEQAIAISPCVLFLDEVDAIAPHRANAQKEMERRIVAQLLSCLDDLGSKENGDRVLVLGATNRPDALDPALRRAGRFDREVSLGIPDRDARAGILAVHAAKLALAPDVSLSKLAELTPGFVGADLVALIREAATAAVSRVFEQIKKKSNEVELIKDEQVENNASEVKNEVQKKDEEVPKESQSEDNIIVDGDEQPEATTSGQRSPSLLKNADLPIPAPMSEIDEIQAVSKSEELTGLLTWLHDEPPLSAEYLAGLFIEHGDFEVALQVVQPSAKREGFATVPDVTWDDVGSLQDIRQELQMAILAPVRHSEHFAALGLTSPTGLLLCGPPGCGKTLLAKAIANEAGINFISVKGPELLNMYVGESEKAVRQCFIRARNSAPCVIFFDELDALCPKRSEGDSSATSRVVNQMLTEMDGVEARRGVFLMAASNRPDIIDPAVLRPGRLDKIIYVGLPTASDRIDILRALTKNGTKPKLAVDVDLEQVGSNSRCDGYTGADLAALIREAGMEALKESMTGPPGLAEVCTRHITAAFDKIRPSVHEKDVKHYETLRKLFSVVKKSSEVTPMETPIDAPLVDTTMEAMET